MRALITGLIVGVTLAQGTSAYQDPTAIWVDVGVVRPNVESVAGLSEADFELLIDGQTHPIKSLSAKSRTVCLAVILDVTASMYLTHTKYRFGRSWSSAIGASDRIIVGSIARPLRMSSAFTSDRRELQASVDAAFARPGEERSGPSPVWDAIDGAITALERERDVRRSVVVVTDGLSTGNARSFGAVVSRAVEVGVSVSVVYTPTREEQQAIPQTGGGEVRSMAEAGLLKLVDETGGIFRYAGDGQYANPEPHVERIIRWLHEGYVLGFSPPVGDGKSHRLDIKVKRPGLVVLARKAFVAPADGRH